MHLVGLLLLFAISPHPLEDKNSVKRRKAPSIDTKHQDDSNFVILPGRH
jgi:hypothetical protein